MTTQTGNDMFWDQKARCLMKDIKQYNAMSLKEWKELSLPIPMKKTWTLKSKETHEIKIY